MEIICFIQYRNYVNAFGWDGRPSVCVRAFSYILTYSPFIQREDGVSALTTKNKYIGYHNRYEL